MTMALGMPVKIVRTKRQMFVGIAGVLLVLHVAITLWGHEQLDRTLVRIVSGMTHDIFEVQHNLVKQWYRGEREMVQSWANMPSIETSTSALLALAPEQRTTSADYRKLSRIFNDIIDTEQYRDYVITNLEGRVVFSRDDGRNNTLLNPNVSAWITAVADHRRVTLDLLHHNQLFDVDAEPDYVPILPFLAPIEVNGEVIAVLLVAASPEQEFSGLFNIIDIGNSFDMFAFNRNGFLITESRHTAQLKDSGTLINTSVNSTILNARLVVPGHESSTPPLTLNAARTLNEKESFGYELEEYINYAGDRVIGAWFWDEEIGLGMALELSVDDAGSIVAPLRIAEIAIFGFLALTMVAALVFSYINHRLKSRVEEIEQLGQYQLLQKIGEGGMGEVYYAKHAMLLRPTAVKLLRKDANKEVLERFEKEVRHTSMLTHPNTIEIYDYGMTASGRFYYAMEYVHGFDLGDLLERFGRLPQQRVVHIIRQVVGSLKEAHAAGLVHRDIKPLNIMLTKRSGAYDEVKVLDFGLVKLSEEDNDLTQTQVLRGTPTYIAPERLTNARCAEPSVDIYSIGAIAYNLVTGDDLYEATTQLEIMSKAMTEKPKPIRATVDFPVCPALEALIMSCLEKDPNHRPKSMSELLEQLDAIEMADDWTQTQAKQWWQQHEEALPARPPINTLADLR